MVSAAAAKKCREFSHSRQTASDVREEIQHEATSTVEQVARTSGEAIRELKDVFTGSQQGRPEQEPAGGRRSGRGESKADPQQADPVNLIGEMFRAGQEVTRAIDEVGQELLGLSTEEQRRPGPEVHSIVLQNVKVLDSPASVRRLQELAEPWLARRFRDSDRLTIVIMAGDEVNAFAHVGGYVYLHKGMLDFAESDAELQFILAHEIAHIELGHCARKLTYAARAAEIGGGPAATMAQQAYLMIASGYSHEDEFEADAWAYRTMRETGRTREETLAFFHRYVKGFCPLPAPLTQACSAAEFNLRSTHTQ